MDCYLEGNSTPCLVCYHMHAKYGSLRQFKANSVLSGFCQLLRFITCSLEECFSETIVIIQIN